MPSFAAVQDDPMSRITQEFSGYPEEHFHGLLDSETFFVDKESLKHQIDELSSFSDSPPPSVTRILYSMNDVLACRYVKSLMEGAGLRVREDAEGNIFGHWEGSNPELSAVATGSHIDAIPYSDKFDGVVGVLGAIEAINVLRRLAFKPKRSLEPFIGKRLSWPKLLLHRDVLIEIFLAWRLRGWFFDHSSEVVLKQNGETGSRKTTQRPQIINRQGFTKAGMVDITQSRRVASVPVSRRVAS